MKDALGGALVTAAAGTLGDFIWAMWIPAHRMLYGVVHGMLLFLCVGLYLGVLTRQPAKGAIAGALAGSLAAGGFYALAPWLGSAAMFPIWVAVWMTLGLLSARLSQRALRPWEVLTRSSLAAVLSGAAFYGVSGIWSPFDPRGWDYAVHFVSWTVAVLPGFLALLMPVSRSGSAAPDARTPPSPPDGR